MWHKVGIVMWSVVIPGVLVLALMTVSRQAMAASAKPTVITLTQTGCQFLEPEQRDLGFEPASAADCKAINKQTGKERLANAETLELSPGPYIFRVSNTDVPYELGFYLRGASLAGRFTLPKVSGGGLTPGKTKDYHIELKEGEYVYSCPLNPTPDYRLIVEQ
jgi:hypothetical protein